MSVLAFALLMLAEPVTIPMIDGIDVSDDKFRADMETVCYRDPDCFDLNWDARLLAVSAFAGSDAKRQARIVKAIRENTADDKVNWRWVPALAGIDPTTKPPRISVLDILAAGYMRASPRVDCKTKISKDGRKSHTTCW